MSADNSWGTRLTKGVMAIVLCLVVVQANAYSAQSSAPSQKATTRQAPFTLTIKDNLKPLTARDASSKAMLKETGRSSARGVRCEKIDKGGDSFTT